jgi:glycosyltransferase involved in cell wall biosynthesis
MNVPTNLEEPKSKAVRDCILIAAYDAGIRTSEGYVARSILERLNSETRVILITRKNNVAELRADSDFCTKCPNVHLVGFDLPKWATWWKRGPRFYGPYAYLWQVIWPFVVKRRTSLIPRLTVVHSLNFHNDSLPSMGWILGRPSVWGPINHNEGIARWRTSTWPKAQQLRVEVKAIVRRLLWRIDPLLSLAIRNTDLILSAGSWVDHRLRLIGRENVRHRSQLGLDTRTIPHHIRGKTGGLRLVSGGRLDWIKGLDLAIAALVQLPPEATLTLIGDGPCRSFLEEYADRLGVADRVKFHPAVPREDLLAMYGDFDLFLFTSAEAGGLSWVEALATGLPVVGFEGPTELAEKSRQLRGVRVAPALSKREDSIAALAEAILMETSTDHDSEAIADEVRSHYDWDQIATEVYDAYQIAADKMP